MPIERQVVSLELAKRLKELGVQQDAFFSWCRYENEPEHRLVYFGMAPEYLELKEHIAAFTVAELGEMLPENIVTTWRHKCSEGCAERYRGEFDGYFMVSAHKVTKYETNWQTIEKTEADARAKMLVYLIEKKLVKL